MMRRWERQQALLAERRSKALIRHLKPESPQSTEALNPGCPENP
jgi:hypothetical protein